MYMKIKRKRTEEIMNLQSNISYKLKKIGSTLKVLFDRKEDDYFIGRTEFDSPNGVNEFLAKAD